MDLDNLIPGVLLVLPFAFYISAMLRSKIATDDPEDFFLARNRVSPVEFSNTSIAYGFQIASISIFIAWGYHYGLGAFVNPIFWGLGIVLFSLVLARTHSFFSKAQSLHGFLGKQYQSKSITTLAAFITLVGFLGAFTAELVWGSSVLRIIFNEPSHIQIAMTTMAVFVLIYVLRAGQVSVVKTDQYQLIFAYASFLTLLVFLISLLHKGDETTRAVGFLTSLTGLILLSLVALSIYRQLQSASQNDEHLATKILFGLVALTILGLLINVALFTSDAGTVKELSGERNLLSFELGAMNLLSLALLPLFWQFADVTMWQRLSSVRGIGSQDTHVFSEVKRGLLRYALESPVTWILAILCGIALRYGPIDVGGEAVYDGLAQIPLALGSDQSIGLIGGIVAGIFAGGIVAAMLSTADSFMIASAFVLTYDVAGYSKKEPSEGTRKHAITIGRYAAIAMIVIGLGGYWLASSFGFDIISILFGAFSAQVALSGPVLGTLLLGKNAANAKWVVMTLITGLAGALYATLVAQKNPEWALYGPLWALGCSWPVYIIGVLTRPRDQKTD